MSFPIASMQDHFAALGLPRAYDIAPNSLRDRYLQLARAAHPDAGGSNDGRRAAELNEGRRVLSDPVLRAEHLLALSGGQDAAANRVVPPEVLSSTLELREELEAAKASGDASAVERIRATVQDEHTMRLDMIARLARQLPGGAELQNSLRIELNSLKYQQRILEHIDGAVEL